VPTSQVRMREHLSHGFRTDWQMTKACSLRRQRSRFQSRARPRSWPPHQGTTGVSVLGKTRSRLRVHRQCGATCRCRDSYPSASFSRTPITRARPCSIPTTLPSEEADDFLAIPQAAKKRINVATSGSLPHSTDPPYTVHVFTPFESWGCCQERDSF
jgi:hypothetical protein